MTAIPKPLYDFHRSKAFLKHYARLPEKLQKKVKQVIKQLAENSQYPGLGVKKMVNHDRIWEARVDIHYHITFERTENLLILRKIGTHEIYRNP